MSNKKEELKALIDEQIDALSPDDLEAVSGGGVLDILNNIPMYECTSCKRVFKVKEAKLIVNNKCPDCNGTVEFCKVKTS